MAIALLLYVLGLAHALLVPVGGRFAAPAPVTLPAPDDAAIRQAAWSGPLSVGVLVVAMYAMTALAFALLRALPVIGTGSGGH
jgi:hypothetical protein